MKLKYIVGKDFKGQKLCENCWNGRHYTYERNGKGAITATFINCLQGQCECLCVEKLREPKRRRIKRGYSLQLKFLIIEIK